ncbi:unnamed protein product [Periconia digitata]|uniref:Uncharacterized protein n=1 Tax=Periconia digitata TaxID=1303443 RepID=A0A9W4U9Q9_9PLEO|nr:unnamed protein product [Periconia digitata]
MTSFWITTPPTAAWTAEKHMYHQPQARPSACAALGPEPPSTLQLPRVLWWNKVANWPSAIIRLTELQTRGSQRARRTKTHMQVVTGKVRRNTNAAHIQGHIEHTYVSAIPLFPALGRGSQLATAIVIGQGLSGTEAVLRLFASNKMHRGPWSTGLVASPKTLPDE